MTVDRHTLHAVRKRHADGRGLVLLLALLCALVAGRLLDPAEHGETTPADIVDAVQEAVK